MPAKTRTLRVMVLGIHDYQKKREQQQGGNPIQKDFKPSFRMISKKSHQRNGDLFPVREFFSHVQMQSKQVTMVVFTKNRTPRTESSI